MKKLLILLFCLLLSSSSVYAQCPSKPLILRFVVTDEITLLPKIAGVEIPKEFFEGTEQQCPGKDVVVKILRTNFENNTQSVIDLYIPKGSLNDPDNVLDEEEEILFREKGIINPPKIQAPNKKQTLVNVRTESLSSSTN